MDGRRESAQNAQAGVAGRPAASGQARKSAPAHPPPPRLPPTGGRPQHEPGAPGEVVQPFQHCRRVKPGGEGRSQLHACKLSTPAAMLSTLAPPHTQSPIPTQRCPCCSFAHSKIARRLLLCRQPCAPQPRSQTAMEAAPQAPASPPPNPCSPQPHNPSWCNLPSNHPCSPSPSTSQTPQFNLTQSPHHTHPTLTRSQHRPHPHPHPLLGPHPAARCLAGGRRCAAPAAGSWPPSAAPSSTCPES